MNIQELTDRELIELAAKSLGYDIDSKHNKTRRELYPDALGLYVHKEGELKHTCWNPLDTASCCEELEVGHKITVKFEKDFVFAEPSGLHGCLIYYDDCVNIASAKRRAVTKAAVVQYLCNNEP